MHRFRAATRYARSRGHDRQTAEDIAQRAELALADRFDPAKGTESAFFWATVRWSCLHAHRQRHRHPVAATAPDELGCRDPAVARLEARLTLGPALAALSVEARDAVEARLDPGFDGWASVAAQRGIPAATLRKRFQRAIDRMRAFYADSLAA